MSLYLTRAEVAERYNLSKSYLDKAAMAEPLFDGPPIIRIGRKCLYKPADVEAWLDRQSVKTEPRRRRGRPTKADTIRRRGGAHGDQ